MMALSKHSTYVDDMLTCAVCLELVHDPRTLQQCFHSYCKNCVEEVMKKQDNKPPGITCPVCRSFSKDTEVRNNFFITDLLEMHQNAQEVDEGKQNPCQQCPNNEPHIAEAKFKCIDCKIMLCRRCHLSHLNVPLLRNHQLLSLNQKTELVIDHLVFCELHSDEVIKFYCTECSLPICIKCKVSVHNNHSIETVETALQHLVPDIEENTKYLNHDLESIQKSIELADLKLAEVAELFIHCEQDVEAKFEERIQELQEQKKSLMTELGKRKKDEVEKIKGVKEGLINKKKEGESIKNTVMTTLGKAKNAALLTHIVKGGLHVKMEEYRWKKTEVLNIKLEIPKLNISGERKQDFFGKLSELVQGEVSKKLHQYGLPTPLLSITAGNKELDLLGRLCYSGSYVAFNTGYDKYMANPRFWGETFDAVFSKSMKRVLNVNLPSSACKRMFMIKENILVPEREQNKIIRFQKNGTLLGEYEVNNPRSVCKVKNDIFIASSLGIHNCNDMTQMSTQIIAGDFTDLFGYNSEVYCLAYDNNHIIVLSEEDNDKWRKKSVIELERMEKRNDKDTLLVAPSEAITDAFHIYVALWSPNLVLKFDRNGVCLREYGKWPKLHGPLLSGIDVDMKLVVTNGFQLAPVGPKIIDLSCNDKVINIKSFSRSSIVCDIVVENKECVWVICVKNNKYRLEKYTIEN